MDENSSATCTETQDASVSLCGSWELSWFISALNIVFCFAIAFHLNVLTRVRHNSNTNYLLLLYSIHTGDLFTAISNLIRYNCGSHSLMSTSRPVCIVLGVLLDSPFMVNLNNLLLGSIDRYIALCKPYLYEDNLLKRNYKKTLVLIWIYPLISLGIMAVAAYDKLRLDDAVACTIIAGHVNWISYLGGIYASAAIAVASVLLIVVHRELSRLRENSVQSEDADQHLVHGARFVIAIVIAYMVGHLPALFTYVLSFLETDQTHLALANKITMTIYSFGGIVNIAIYGVTSKPYRDAAKSWITCRDNRVQAL